MTARGLSAERMLGSICPPPCRQSARTEIRLQNQGGSLKEQWIYNAREIWYAKSAIYAVGDGP
jgi:hypothetical protein